MKRSERELIEHLRQRAARLARGSRRKFLLRQGIGDDCAILSGGGREELLVTTDLLLEAIHFRREWQPPDSIGHKVLLRGLSDIAAMGGTPRCCFLSLALPPDISGRWMGQFFSGLFHLAEASGVILAGGDTARSPAGLLADIVVIGTAPRGKAVLRSGARLGDEIWVSGELGGAAEALRRLRQGGRAGQQMQRLRPLFYPQPRLKLGRLLAARGLASAMMDLSDGLSIDLARLCKASGVGATIDAEAVPRFPEASLEQALHGGEDFELLFTVPPRRARRLPQRAGGVPLTRIGQITRGPQLWLVRKGRAEPLPVRGFEHF
ncbi:MAG TPA: thiamine-phosphate kinase [Terriglobia bacterium]|nr:thiamine-phosphate kinase [Terriglobia bacterium]